MRLLALGELPEKDLCLLHGDAQQDVEVTTLGFTVPVVLEGGPIILCRDAPVDRTPEAVQAAALATIQVPVGAENVVCLVKSGDGARSLETQAINLDDSRFPWGSRLIWNFSAYPVVIQFGDERFQISPNSSSVISPPNAEAGTFLRVDGWYQNQQKEEVQFLGSRWINDLDSRGFIFLYPSAGGRLDYHGLEEPRPLTEAELERGGPDSPSETGAGA